MSIDVTCIPERIVYQDPISGYKIIACTPLDNLDNIITNENYGTFTISGKDLGWLRLKSEVCIAVEHVDGAKYPETYQCLGVGGVHADGERLMVAPEDEEKILCSLMSEAQAKNCHEAYPNFVQLILDGREDEIGVEKIYNVGKKRLKEYIQKIRAHTRIITFFPCAKRYKITDNSDIKILATRYDTPAAFENEIKLNPYYVYIEILKWTFYKSDDTIASFTTPSQALRCHYACLEILRLNENETSWTRMRGNALANAVYKIAPETKEYIVPTIKEDEDIFFDPVSKMVGLRSTYLDEKKIADAIKDRIEQSPFSSLNYKDYLQSIELDLTDEQKLAVEYAATKNIMMLIGPAGSGKSASTKAIVQMLKGNLQSFLLLAPTGIAAHRLKEATGEKASTINLHLATNKSSDYDYIIIDEMSMVSVSLLSSLLATVPSSAKLIFICDEAQLASISPGNIVYDILKADIVPTVRLTKIFRYNSSGIATVATDARMGEFNPDKGPFPDFTFEYISNNPVAQVIDTYKGYLKKKYKPQDILVLTPFNVGELGTYVMNNAIQDILTKHTNKSLLIKRNANEFEFRQRDKVLYTKNNYSATVIIDDDTPHLTVDEYETNTGVLVNGDLGQIRSIEKTSDNSTAIIASFNEQLFLIEKDEIANLSLGYSETIHKSQGSQAKVVIIVVDKSHQSLLSRNLFYVAASRAQEYLHIIGDPLVIQEGLQTIEHKERNTWLYDLLKEGGRV